MKNTMILLVSQSNEVNYTCSHYSSPVHCGQVIPVFLLPVAKLLHC